ncbi:MAG: BON domain-containing protein [Pirellulaceae bacterium]
MRRLIVGMAMMAMVSMPVSAWAGDREIAEQIIAKLKTHRDSGALKDFKVDLKVNNGTVALTGSVASQAQRQLVLNATKDIDGIRNVLDQMQFPSGTAAADKPVEQKNVEFVAPRLVKAKPAVEAVAEKPAAARMPKPTIINPTPKLIADKTDGVVKPAGEVVVPEAVRPQSDKPATQLATAIEPLEGKEQPAPKQPQQTIVKTMPMLIVIPDNIPSSTDVARSIQRRQRSGTEHGDHSGPDQCEKRWSVAWLRNGTSPPTAVTSSCKVAPLPNSRKRLCWRSCKVYLVL